jgi:hypothetical protein
MYKYIIITALFLTGCAGLFPQSYDNVLYDHYVQAAVIVKESGAMCNNPTLVDSNIRSVLTILDGTILYEQYRNEPQLIQATVLIRNDLTQLVNAYVKPPAPSESYCRLKLQIEEASLDRILFSIGGKPQ